MDSGGMCDAQREPANPGGASICATCKALERDMRCVRAAPENRHMPCVLSTLHHQHADRRRFNQAVHLNRSTGHQIHFRFARSNGVHGDRP